MALADIINRIEGDAGREARELTEAAKAEAKRIVDEAKGQADRDAEATLARAAKDADVAAATIRANARLAARDAAVARKGELVDEVLERARKSLAELPDEKYAALLAREVAASLRGGEKLLFGAADAPRLRKTLPAALAKLAAASVDVSGESSPFERGVLVKGRRSLVEVSPASIVEARRDDLAGIAASALFGERD